MRRGLTRTHRGARQAFYWTFLSLYIVLLVVLAGCALRLCVYKAQCVIPRSWLLLGELILVMAVVAVRALTATLYATRLQSSLSILVVALLGALPHLGLYFAYLGVVQMWAKIAQTTEKLGGRCVRARLCVTDAWGPC